MVTQKLSPDAYGIDNQSIPSIHHGATSDGPPLPLAHMEELIQKIKLSPRNLFKLPGLRNVQMDVLPIDAARRPIPREGIKYPHLSLPMVNEYQPTIFRCHTDQGPGLLLHTRFVTPFLAQGLHLAPGDRFKPITLQAIDESGINTDYFLFEGSKLQESQYGSGFRIETRADRIAAYGPDEEKSMNPTDVWWARDFQVQQSPGSFPAVTLIENPNGYDIWLPTSFANDVAVFLSAKAYSILTAHREIQPKYRKRHLLPTYYSLEALPLVPRVTGNMVSKTIVGYSRPPFQNEILPEEWAMGYTFPRGELPRIAALQATRT